MKKHLSLSVLLLLPACASSPEARTPDQAQGSDSAEQTAEPLPGKDPAVGRVEISDRIREACGIDSTDAYFAYNSAAVLGNAERLLSTLATCFTTGPLKGVPIKLVGHADPRGEDEYNMLLGQRRADNVKKLLVRFGTKDSQLATTSRGEMDANGLDEQSWTLDRRVEVKTD